MNIESAEIKELKDMIKAYNDELRLLFDIAQRLDSMNPELQGAFTGNASERINRQLKALGIF